MVTNIFKSMVKLVLFLLAIICLNLIVVNAKDIQVKVDTKTISESNKNLTFDLKYPEVKLDNEQAQNKINIKLKEDIYEFKGYVESILKESLQTFPQDVIDNSSSFNYEGKSTFEYEVVGNVLSIRMTLIDFTGGAHPMTYLRGYNFDLTTGNILTLEDLFNEKGKDHYKEMIDKIIIDKMNETPDNYFVDEFKGLGKNPQYYLTNEGIVVFFQLYEIAPYVAGIPKFFVPYSKVEGELNTSLNINVNSNASTTAGGDKIEKLISRLRKMNERKEGQGLA